MLPNGQSVQPALVLVIPKVLYVPHGHQVGVAVTPVIVILLGVR